MSDLQPIFWASQSTRDRSQVATAERLLNCYLQPNTGHAKAPFKILGAPGLKFWATFGSGPIRGALSALGKWFVVSGAELYVVSADKSSVMIGAVPGGGPVCMCANATHVAIATNLGLYVATTMAIANVDGNNYSSATYQDGYGIFQLAGTEQWYISGLDDLTTVSALDYTVADMFPDNGLCAVSLNRRVTVFGAETLQSYYNSGDPYFPFSPISGSEIEIGCGAALSPAKAKDSICWLANDWSVQRLVGGQPQQISTPGIEKWIASRLNPSEARGLRYRQEGNDFYVLNFADGTICYDIATGLWHERQSWLETRWRVETVSHVFGLDLAGDFESGNVYEISLDTHYEENGAGVTDWRQCVMQSAPLHGAGNPVFMPELYLDCEMGVGNASTPGEDPQFALDWSDNGGLTWSNEVNASAGAIGDGARRATWHQLGQFYQRTMRVTFSDPCKLAIMGAYARLELCNG